MSAYSGGRRESLYPTGSEYTSVYTSASRFANPRTPPRRPSEPDRPYTPWQNSHAGSSPPRPPKEWSERRRMDENINKAAEGLYYDENHEASHSSSRHRGPFDGMRERMRAREGGDRERERQRFQDLRRAMREGRMEQVVPPRGLSGRGGGGPSSFRLPMRAHEPPPTNRYFDRAPRPDYHRPSSSSFGPRASTAAGDDDRAFSGEYPPRPGNPFGREARRARSATAGPLRDDARSGVGRLSDDFSGKLNLDDFPQTPFTSSGGRSDDMDFACIGDDGRTDSMQGQPRSSTYLSGRSPWSRTTTLESCRLCEKPACMRGLCRDCDRDLSRPGLPPVQRRRSRPSWEDDYRREIGPTPPPKDSPFRPPMRRAAGSRFDVGDDEVEDFRPMVPPKDEDPRLGETRSRPTFSQARAYHSSPFSATVEHIDDDHHHRYRRRRDGLSGSEPPRLRRQPPFPRRS